MKPLKYYIKRIPIYKKQLPGWLVCKKLDRMDGKKDVEYCGMNLVKYIPSLNRDEEHHVGMTGTAPTRYGMLEIVFSHVDLTKDDTLLDVGCGKGRSLLYLANNTQCRLCGIEYNEVPAEICKKALANYPQVTVEQGDAFKINPNDYTAFYLFRPFLSKTFEKFAEKLESELTHPVKVVYMSDGESFRYLKSKDNWTLEYRDIISKVHGKYPLVIPQTYSVWTCNPKK